MNLSASQSRKYGVIYSLIFCCVLTTSFGQQAFTYTNSDTINWAEFDLDGPRNKIYPTPWFKWWYIPVAVIPPTIYFTTRDKEEGVLPPTLNCLPDQALIWGQTIPPPSPGAIEAINYCPDGDLIVVHLGDESNNGSACEGDPLVIERTYQASDACGNVVTCVQTFSFTVDDESPVLTCPPDVTLQWGETVPAANIDELQVSDNCTEVEDIILSHVGDEDNGASGCVGDERVIQRTYRAIDTCGNAVTCVQTFSYAVDNESPVLTCPPDVTLQWGETVPAANIDELQVSDNCTEVEDIILSHVGDEDNGASGCVGDERVIQRTYRAIDACGNAVTCVQTFSFTVDDESPVLTCPPDVTLQWGETVPAANIDELQVSDNCTEVEDIILSHVGDEDNGASGCVGDERVIQRTYRAIDACGNTVTCVQTFSYAVDNESPVLTCPPDVTLECSDDFDPANVGEASASDNCTPLEEIIIEYEDDFSGLTECNATGVIIRTWTATDNCGNISSCNQTIRLEDTTSPVFTDVPVDITVDCENIPPPFAVNASDNCMFDASPDITFSETTGTGCPYSVTRTWVAIDECGNSSTITQIITVEDNTSPEISCPADVIVLCGEVISPIVTGLPIGFDNCTDFTIDYTDDLSNQTGCAGFIIRTFEVVDECGNVSTCQQIIQIVDTGCEFNPMIMVDAAECLIPDGSISITPEPGFIYSWSNGQTGPLITDLVAGVYNVTIINADVSCSQIVYVTVPEAPPFELVVLQVNNPSSMGVNDGSVELLINNPNVLYPVNIFLNGILSGQSSTSVFTINNLTAGVYTILVVDLNGCASEEVMVELMDGLGFSIGKEGPEWRMSYNPNLHSITNWNVWHDQTFYEDQILENLSTIVEHVPVLESTDARYLPIRSNMISVGKNLAPDLVLNTGFGSHTGKLEASLLFESEKSMHLSSSFSAWQVNVGLQKYFFNTPFKAFSGVDIFWKELTVGNSQFLIDHQFYHLNDTYSEEGVDFNIRAGFQLPIEERLNIEIGLMQFFEIKNQALLNSNLQFNRLYQIDLLYQF